MAAEDHDELRKLGDLLMRSIPDVLRMGHVIIDRAAIPLASGAWPRNASGATPSTRPAPIVDPGTPEDEHGESIDYADPTGNAAASPPLERDHARQLRNAMLKAMRDALDAVERTRERLAVEPHLSKLTTVEPTCPEGCCKSCWRLDKRNDPIAMHSDGRVKYADLCRDCGDWAGQHGGAVPPLLLVEELHKGNKKTTKLMDEVERLHAAELARKAAERKAAKGKKRKVG